MKAIAVIGAGYGDEGKGLTVDYLASAQAAKGQRPLVARFNGGAQAGHTVVAPDGRRHVFHHVGSGSFQPSARTYLSSLFVINPFVLRKELHALAAIGIDPLVYAHPRCKVTMIHDMALNSLAELARGQERHGSCGLGVNETVTRAAAGFPLELHTVIRMSVDELADYIENIVVKWVPARLEELGLTNQDLEKHELYGRALAPLADYRPTAELMKELVSPLIMLNKTSLEELQASIELGQDIILEGAQGLGLDEHLGSFPHVTRSITGLPSALAVAVYELGAHEVEPLYVTRAYTTRHGAGPLFGEGEAITSKAIIDTTNVDNQWQGAIRLAPLNLQLLKELISADVLRAQLTPAVTARGAVVLKPQLMITCMDQLGDDVQLVTEAGTFATVRADELIRTVAVALGREVAVTYCSHGPTATHVKPLT